MTGAAIRELDQLFGIICSPLTVAAQTPTHVHHLWVNGNLSPGHIPVTLLAIQSRGNMWAVCEVDKVRHLGDGHPGNFPVVQNIIFQDSQFWTCIRLCDLLMTAPALGESRQAGRGSAQGARVAVQALHAQTDMDLMCKLNRLLRRPLRVRDPKCSEAE